MGGRPKGACCIQWSTRAPAPAHATMPRLCNYWNSPKKYLILDVQITKNVNKSALFENNQKWLDFFFQITLSQDFWMRNLKDYLLASLLCSWKIDIRIGRYSRHFLIINQVINFITSDEVGNLSGARVCSSLLLLHSIFMVWEKHEY